MGDGNSTYTEEIPGCYDLNNNSSYIHKHNDYYNFIVFHIMNSVTLVIGLPAVSLALYVIYRQFKASHVANVYVINLLILDMIQFLGRLWMFFAPAESYASAFFWVAVFSAIVSSLVFMLCIAMERYLLIAHPHWYRSHFTLKLSVVSSLVAWLVSLAVVFFLVFSHFSCFSVMLLLIPLPLLLFFFVGTWRGLSKTITLSGREKKRILTTLLLVIVNYTFFFFPQVISYYQEREFISLWADFMLLSSPLLDSLLYIFIRKDTKHIMEEFPCCHKSTRNEEETVSSIAVSENTRSG